MHRAALPICLFAVASPLAQPVSPAEQALELEAAWASARLQGTAVLMASGDYFEVTAQGSAQGRARMVKAPQPGYWEDACVGWTYGRAALVHCVEGRIDRPFTPLRRTLRVFVREGLDWRVALSHSVPMRDDGHNDLAVTPDGAPRLDTEPEVEPPVLRAHVTLARAVTQRDVSTADRLTASEFVAIAADGSMSYREAFIRRVRNPQTALRPPVGQPRLRRYGRLAVVSWQEQPGVGGAHAPWTTRVLATVNGSWVQIATIGGS